MAYTDDTVKARLSALNDTQESIVTMAQWIMFHRKHAERSATLWLERMHDAGPSKRLTLIYLVNEVVQQSKARKKDDFLTAFSPIIVDATIAAYKSASGDTQNRLRRVVDVWRQRSIFDSSIQSTLEAQINEIDKSAAGSGSGGRKTLMGGSLFSSSSAVPSELETLAKHQQELSKARATFDTTVKAATTEYTTMTDPSRVPPTQPVHARQLGLLMQKLSAAETAVTKSLEARKSIISELEKLLEANRQAIAPLEDQQKEFAAQKAEISAKHQEVEDQIMKGLPPADQSSNGGYDFDEDRRPQEEPLTPPPMESFTPPDEPTLHPLDPPPLDLYPEPDQKETPPTEPTSLSSVIDPRKSRARPAASNSPPPLVKRRKPSGEEDEIPGFSNGDAMEGLDADVVGMLK